MPRSQARDHPRSTSRPVQHALGRPEGTGDRAQVDIAPGRSPQRRSQHAGTLTYWANEPSKSEPIQMVSSDAKPRGRMQGRTRTRRRDEAPVAPGSDLDDAPATVRALDQGERRRPAPPTATGRRGSRLRILRGARRAISDVRRVPAQARVDVGRVDPGGRTCSRASPAAGLGMGTSRYSRLSKPPSPGVTTAAIVAVRSASSKRSGGRTVCLRITSSTEATGIALQVAQREALAPGWRPITAGSRSRVAAVRQSSGHSTGPTYQSHLDHLSTSRPRRPVSIEPRAGPWRSLAGLITIARV